MLLGDNLGQSGAGLLGDGRVYGGLGDLLSHLRLLLQYQANRLGEIGEPLAHLVMQADDDRLHLADLLLGAHRRGHRDGSLRLSDLRLLTRLLGGGGGGAEHHALRELHSGIAPTAVMHDHLDLIAHNALPSALIAGTRHTDRVDAAAELECHIGGVGAGSVDVEK